MTAAPRQVLLMWVESALQAARSTLPPREQGARVEDLERLAAELRSLELATEKGP